MRWLLLMFAFLIFSVTQRAHAQLAAPETNSGVLGCLQVTPAVMKAHEKNSARCPGVCKGCGCNGGPGYRDAKGCVGFKDIISRCGQAPHIDNGCRAVCRIVQPACLLFGRAWIAANAKELNLVLIWTSPPDGTDKPVADTDQPRSLDLVRDQKATQAEGKTEFRCGEKRTCGEMASCEEAKFHLTQCGLSRLDGTKTGVPCKAICGH